MVGLLVSASSVLFAQSLPPVTAAVAKPAVRIDLAFLGYREPSRTERLIEDEASISLDFVDANHVLLTFDPRKLLTRLPSCPHTHDDRMIHAAILEIPSGKTVREADWYVHDRHRYLWRLGDGRFLLRKLNSVYVVDSSLHEKLLLNSPRDVVWLTVSANGKQIILETEKTAEGAKSSSADASKKSKFLLDFVDVASGVSQQTIESDRLVHLNGAGTGYADVLRKGDLWLIRFGPGPTERQNIARVRSQCTPDVFYSASNELLIGRCAANGADYSVSAFTVTGRRLWRQRWNRKRFSPAVGRSDDERRFVVSSFTVPQWTRSVPNSDESETDSSPGLEQQVQIVNSASGDLVLSLVASPTVLGGQNVSLSPDGSQVAILHNSEIELYDLPRVSEEEQAKFTALQADVPGLYIVSKSDSGSGSEDPTDIADDSVPLSVPGTGGSDDSNPSGAGPSLSPAVSPTLPATRISSATLTDKEDTSQPLVTLKVSARAVSVDVVVTDAKGRPVKGLQRGDFQLTEDGKTQNVHYFHEFAAAEAAKRVAPKPAKSAANVFTNVTDAPDPGSVTVILLDLLNTPSADQPFARQQLVKFLKGKPKDLQFALCTLGADKNLRLRLIQGFTQDEDLLLAAVNGNKADAKTARWQAAAEAKNAVDAVTDLARSDSTGHWENLLSGVQKMQAYEQDSDTNDRVGLTLDALSQLARYLSGLPGRKNLVWLSGSFPVSIAPNPELDNPSGESHNYANLVRQAASLMAKGQIAVYPVDVRGLAGGDVTAGTNSLGLAPSSTQSALPVAAGQAARDGSFAKPGQVSLISPNEAFQDQSMQSFGLRAAEFETMNQVAQGTGGKAFYNSNAIEDAITAAVEQGSNYYALSYTPANKNYDGKFRKIKVALAAKGYHLHYRPGYFADDPYAPVKNAYAADNITTAAMQHGSPQSRQIRFAARVVPVGPKKQVANAEGILIASRKRPALPARVEVQHYAIDFAVDSSDLRFITKENGDHSGALKLMVAAYSEDGRRLSSLSSIWAGDLKAAEYKNVVSGGFRVKQELDVPIQAISLRLGIEDQKSSFLGTIELPLPVPLPPDLPRTAKHSLPEIEPE